MIEFANPWAFLLLGLPVFVYWLVPPYRQRQSALRVPFFGALTTLAKQTPRQAAVVVRRGFLAWLLLALSWACVVTAIARPQLIGDPIIDQKSARDLMIAVDLSASMEARDFTNAAGEKVDRLTAVKSVLREFVANRPHDRLGLIVFGDAPFLQVPFTQDHTAWLELLAETRIAMAGMSTALGDAIGLAIQHFASHDTPHRVLILLSDGNDTGSRVPPIEAAKVALEYAVTVYPIAIGDPQTLGQEALDVATLKRLADITGGEFYQALDRDELAQIYQRINALQPQLFETQSYQPKTDMHHWPMAAATLLLLCLLLSAAVQQSDRRGLDD